MSGNDTRNQTGIYGTKGWSDSGNIPGARYMSVSWTDANDNFWLFGGDGYDGTGSTGYLNDLWMFDTTNGLWTWMSGNDTRNQNGTYGTKGILDGANTPGSRFGSVSWKDASTGFLWLFGGYGFDSTGNVGYLNDLWAGTWGGWWKWMSGNTTRNQTGIYGTKGVSAKENVPGARQFSVTWKGAGNDLWLLCSFRVTEPDPSSPIIPIISPERIYTFFVFGEKNCKKFLLFLNFSFLFLNIT